MLTFVRQALKDFHHTGAPLPSSRWLARTMTGATRRGVGPRRVLEVGAGIGSITQRLIELLLDGDELHVVEMNPVFCARLERRWLAPYRAAHPEASVHLYCDSIETAPLCGTFDHVICSLPFNNFPLPRVRKIFRRIFSLMSEGCELSYFEYAGFRALRAPFVSPRVRRSMSRRVALQTVLCRRYHGRRELVLGNVPPAVAIHLRRCQCPD